LFVVCSQREPLGEPSNFQYVASGSQQHLTSQDPPHKKHLVQLKIYFCSNETIIKSKMKK
jgi:hypothetical protein